MVDQGSGLGGVLRFMVASGPKMVAAAGFMEARAQ